MPDLSSDAGSAGVPWSAPGIGYLFECERRGYLQAQGRSSPEVVLDHPEVVEEAQPRVRARGLQRW